MRSVEWTYGRTFETHFIMSTRRSRPKNEADGRTDRPLHYANRSNVKYRATVRLLLHTNSAVNYFIYASRVKDFREAFRRDHVLLACRRPSISSSHGSSATFTSYAGSFANTEHIRLATMRHDDQLVANGTGHYSRSHRPSIV